MSFVTTLDAMKTNLASIKGVKTCAVGLEANITPASYPMIRLVPTQFRKSDKAAHYRICDLAIYFGLPLVEGKTSAETIYKDLIEMETKVIDATRMGDTYRSTYQKTMVSTSEVEHYKLFCVFLEVEFEA